jgi:ribosome-associated translation inhibitor RaiA
MKPAVTDRTLPINWDTRHCELSPADRQKLEANLEPVVRLVRDFPVSALHLQVEHFPRSTGWRVKMSLVLTGATLTSLDDDAELHPAFDRCVNNLVKDVHAYKDRMSQVEEVSKQAKGTHQEVEPTLDPDPAAVDRAVAEGDYAAFRTATFGYEEPLRKRVGRWVERYPEVSALIDRRIKIDDIVEAVFLDAFEAYEDRRLHDVRFGDWLERLIDPAVKALMAHPDKELENINLARSARVAENGPGAV